MDSVKGLSDTLNPISELIIDSENNGNESASIKCGQIRSRNNFMLFTSIPLLSIPPLFIPPLFIPPSLPSLPPLHPIPYSQYSSYRPPLLATGSQSPTRPAAAVTVTADTPKQSSSKGTGTGTGAIPLCGPAVDPHLSPSGTVL